MIGKEIAKLMDKHGIAPAKPAFWIELEAIAARIEALEAALSELADLMDAVRAGEYKPDSFTTQPARAALAPEQDK